MSQRTDNKYRDVGLAENRYSSNNEFKSRQKVAEYIRVIADNNRTEWDLKGHWEGLEKRELSLKRQADRFETCGLQYTMIGCKDCRQVFFGPKRCETRICESCAKKYGARVRSKQIKLAKRLNPNNGRRLMFLTLTKKSHPNFRPQASGVREIFKCTKKLINKLWPNKKGCGALVVLEVGSNNNLHIHALVYGYYVPQEYISKLWLKITGDSSVVFIKEVRGARKCINYLLKYITKPPKYEDYEKTAYYLDMMLGVRRIRTYGIFYNYPISKKDTCPCPICNGKLKFIGFDEGRKIPINALFFVEAYEMKKTIIN